MSQRRRHRAISVGLMVWFALSGTTPLVEAHAARVESVEGLSVVYLSGTPYEIGRQHGEALREPVRAMVGQVLSYFRSYLKIPWMRAWPINWWLDSEWRQARPFISKASLEELSGLADGSGVPLRELHRIHAIPDRTYSCASFAAWGRATTDGRLIHVRNLDWSIRAGIQRFPVVFVVHPAGKHAFINVGWAGFVGVLTGINDQQLSIGQIGAKTVDVTLAGEPMVFLMRRTLEEASTLEEATALITQAHRTVGTNYVLADAKARRAIVIETTHRHADVFEANDPREHAVTYARPMPDVVFRADTAVDPIIRNQQLASQGNPTQPGLESPAGSSAYDVRYLGQAAGLSAYYGTLDGVSAQRIAKAVAPGSNVQSVVFAWPDLWVANAQGTTPAAATLYHHLNAAELLNSSALQNE